MLMATADSSLIIHHRNPTNHLMSLGTLYKKNISIYDFCARAPEAIPGKERVYFIAQQQLKAQHKFFYRLIFAAAYFSPIFCCTFFSCLPLPFIPIVIVFIFYFFL